jgi:hypothetical protein
MIAIDQKTTARRLVSICSLELRTAKRRSAKRPPSHPQRSVPSSKRCSGWWARVRRYDGGGVRRRMMRSLNRSAGRFGMSNNCSREGHTCVVPSVATCVVVGLVSLIESREISNFAHSLACVG